MERLQKVLAHAGVASRRKCEELIRQKRVWVNGQTVTELGTKVDPGEDQIEVDGKEIGSEKKFYILFYKPRHVITSVQDPRGRKVVTDFIKVPERIYPVGRLDYDTEGLLLLTNDGELAFKLTHPKHEMDKVYQAHVKGIPNKEKIHRLAAGVRLDDGWTSSGRARMMKVDKQNNQSVIEIVIHEGRNRQVKRMCEAIGHPILNLKRISIGFLTLGDMLPGEYRYLKKEEVNKLKH